MNDEMNDAEFVAALAEATTKTLDAQRVAHAAELFVLRTELEAEIEVVRREIAAHVPPEKGEPGKNAVIDMDALAKEVVALVPVPKDGKDAEPVDRVTLAKDVLALIPVPRDGKDGIASLDDLRAEVAKAVDALVEPTVQKHVTESIAALPTRQYRGVFREGTTYVPGECVTWAGSMWHADSETKEKPGEGETSWTLMVKKGRDSK